LSRERRSRSSWARSVKKLEPDCAVTVEGGADSRSMTWLGSEESEVIDVAGDNSCFETAIARARSAWKRASSSSSLSIERAGVVAGD
jgi:hypothetical protein